MWWWFSNILGHIKFLTAKCLLLVLRAQRETFQGSYMASIRWRPICAPQPSPPVLLQPPVGCWPSCADHFTAGFKANHCAQNICIPIYRKDTFPFSQKCKGRPIPVEKSCPEPYTGYSCTTALVACTSVAGFVHGEIEIFFQLSLLWRWQQVPADPGLYSGCGGGV